MKNQKRLIFGLAMVLLLVIFALINTEPTAINFGITKVKIPLILLIIILLFLGVLIAYLMGRSENPEISKKDLTEQLDQKESELKQHYQKEIKDLKVKIKQQNLEIEQLQKVNKSSTQLLEEDTKSEK